MPEVARLQAIITANVAGLTTAMASADASLKSTAAIAVRTAASADAMAGRLSSVGNAAGNATATVTVFAQRLQAAGAAATSGAGGAARFGSSVSQIPASAANAARSLSGLQGALNAVRGAMGLLQGAFLGFGLLQFGKTVIDNTKRMDSLQRALTSVMGSAAGAAVETKELERIGKLPGLGFEGAMKASVNLQAAGMSAKQANVAIEGFAKALSQVGKGKTEFEFVENELTKLASESKVSGRSIMELSRQVPQLRGVLQHLYGTSDSVALSKMGLTGKKMIGEVSAELAKLKTPTDSLLNAFNNISDAILKSTAAFGAFGSGGVIDVLNGASDALGTLTGGMKALAESDYGKGLAKDFQAAFGEIGRAGSESFAVVRSAFAAFGFQIKGTDVTTAVKVMAVGIKDFALDVRKFAESEGFQRFATGTAAAFRVAVDAVKAAGAALAPVGEFIVFSFAYVEAWFRANMPLIGQTVRTVLSGMQSFWQSHGGNIVALVRGLWGVLTTIIGTAGAVIGGVVRGLMQLISGDFHGLGETVAGVWKSLWDGAMALLQNAVTVFVSGVNTIAGIVDDFAKNLLQNGMNAGYSLLAGIWDGLTKNFGGLIKGVTHMGSDIGNAIQAGIANARAHKPVDLLGGIFPGKPAMSDYSDVLRRRTPEQLETARWEAMFKPPPTPHYNLNKPNGPLSGESAGKKGKESAEAKAAKQLAQELAQATRELTAARRGDDEELAKQIGQYGESKRGILTQIGHVKERTATIYDAKKAEEEYQKTVAVAGAKARDLQQFGREAFGTFYAEKHKTYNDDEGLAKRAYAARESAKAAEEEVKSVQKQKEALAAIAKRFQEYDVAHAEHLASLHASEIGYRANAIAMKEYKEAFASLPLILKAVVLTETQKVMADERMMDPAKRAEEAIKAQGAAVSKAGEYLAEAYDSYQVATGAITKQDAELQKLIASYGLFAPAVAPLLIWAQEWKTATEESDQASEVTKRLTSSVTDSRYQLDLARDGVSDYRRAVHDLGLETVKLSEDQRRQVQSLIELRGQFDKLTRQKEAMRELGQTVKDVFKNAFTDALDHGKDFFDSLIKGTERAVKAILINKASEAIARQVSKAAESVFFPKKKGESDKSPRFSSDKDGGGANPATMHQSAQLHAAALLKASTNDPLKVVLVNAKDVSGDIGTGIAPVIAQLAQFMPGKGGIPGMPQIPGMGGGGMGDLASWGVGQAFGATAGAMTAGIFPIADMLTGGSLSKGLGDGLKGLGKLFGGLFADGGNLPAGKWGVVGERGPELIFGGKSGKSVFSHGDSADMIGNRGGTDSSPQTSGTHVQEHYHYSGPITFNDRADTERVRQFNRNRTQRKMALL